MEGGTHRRITQGMAIINNGPENPIGLDKKKGGAKSWWCSFKGGKCGPSAMQIHLQKSSLRRDPEKWEGNQGPTAYQKRFGRSLIEGSQSQDGRGKVGVLKKIIRGG